MNILDELEILREENRQLREQFIPFIVFPTNWKLTPFEADILRALYASSNGYRSHYALCLAVRTQSTELKVIQVILVHLRRKLKPYKIKIETIWGDGYRLPKESRDIISALVSRSLADEPLKSLIQSVSKIISELNSYKKELQLLL